MTLISVSSYVQNFLNISQNIETVLFLIFPILFGCCGTILAGLRERSLSMAHTGAGDILMGYEIFFKKFVWGMKFFVKTSLGYETKSKNLRPVN